jgi:hypothetical protein
MGLAALVASSLLSTFPGQAQVTIFAENMGTVASTTAIAAHDASGGFQNAAAYDFSGTGDVRTSTPSTGYAGASGTGNIFLTNTSTPRTFIISGINTVGYMDMTLSFGAQKSTTASAMAELVVEVSTDGLSWDLLTFPAQPTGSGTTNWRLVTITGGSIPSSSTVSLRWSNTGGPQFRLDDITLSGQESGGCGISLGSPSTLCNALTPGVDTYDLSIPYTGSNAGVTVINNGASGTIGGSDPAVTANGTIVISGINEGDGYNVTFSTPCDALSVTGASPACEAPACGIAITFSEALCNSVTAGPNDTYDLTIFYTGSQAGVTVVNNSGSGSVLGDDPATTPNGVIVITGISEVDNYSVNFSSPCESLVISGTAPDCEPPPAIVINEVDYDMVGADNAEWVELYNAGSTSVDLTGFKIQPVNGSNQSNYNLVTIPSGTIAPGGYFVVGNSALIPNINLVVTPASDWLQNGSPDGITLFSGANELLDAISYEGSLAAPNVEGTGFAQGDDNATVNKVIARFPNGADTNDNSVDWAVWCATPGASNANAPDADLDGTPDCLDQCPLAVNGIPNFLVATCSCDVGYDPVTTTIGANSVITECALSACGLTLGNVNVTCNSFTIGLSDTYSVAIAYTGSQAGVAVINNSGSGSVGGDDPSTVVDGTILITGISEADAYSITFTAPCSAQVVSGAAPACEPLPSLVINEVDYDQPGTDAAEFVEIMNNGAVPVDLTGMKLVLVNGSTDLPYNTIILNSVVLAAGDHYVIGSASVTSVDQVAFTTNGIQNGNPDGVQLLNAGDLVIDQMSYGGAMPTTEGTSATTEVNVAGTSLSRVPDGVDTNDNSVDFLRACITPGAANTQSDSDNDGTYDCFDLCPGGPEPGTACDDGDPNTGNDVVQGTCICAGEVTDCLGVAGGTALPGTTCDDGDPNTVNDIYQVNCLCAGTPLCSTDLTIEFQTDGNPDETTWEIRTENGLDLVQSGGPLNAPNGVETNFTCLPDGCFTFRVLDNFGDGMTTGGYILRTLGTDQRIIDNRNNFSTGSVSAISGGQGFCLPMSNDKLVFTSCDKLDWINGQYVVASPNPAVSAEWIPSGANSVQDANSGYEFWIFDPNGSYSFRRFRSHNVSDGFGPASATRACHMKLNNWTPASQVPANTLMNVRVRARINGVNGEFGPACRLEINPVLAACPQTNLMDIPGNQFLSCGATRQYGAGNYVHARPVSGANRYQFRFRIPAEGFEVIRTATTYFVQLNWTVLPLQDGKTYDVDVRVSKDGGLTWCTTSDPWGNVCLLTIDNTPANSGNQNFAAEGMDAELRMFPNPNRGDVLNFSLSAIEEGVNNVSVDIYDLTGKRMSARMIAVTDGQVNTTLDLNGELAAGMYVVNIIAGEMTYTERLVIQP